jgi:hypothetical protein
VIASCANPYLGGGSSSGSTNLTIGGVAHRAGTVESRVQEMILKVRKAATDYHGYG